MGLVIATFAAVPFVHLALESWRRNYPHVPVLVCDDGSPREEQLRTLCSTYGASFARNGARARASVGDMSAFVRGFDWAREAELQILVKMSRRFIPLTDWVPELWALARETQYATYSNRCAHFNFGFRTECTAFHVRSWFDAGAVEELRARVARNEPAFVEGYVHDFCRHVHERRCEANQEFERHHPRPPDADGYGVWNIMPDSRMTRKADLLWHDSEAPVDYHRASVLYGLPYRLEDFVDPNEGLGDGSM